MYCANFTGAIDYAEELLNRDGEEVRVERWQGYDTEGKPDLVTDEILNLTLEVPLPNNIEALQKQINPSLPWADDHFEERVGGKALNPDPSYAWWPWTAAADVALTEGGGTKFTHTYSERFWPRQRTRGIRFDYGDLNSVVRLLKREPNTRQAYMPIFFPEDTGAEHGGRIPCTLGYYFLYRHGLLNMWYHIRSCDVVRHFRDDLYLAARLQLWMAEQLDVSTGFMYFTAYSFHVHRGDKFRV